MLYLFTQCARGKGDTFCPQRIEFLKITGISLLLISPIKLSDADTTHPKGLHPGLF
jgi:hypothetical protein